MLGDCEMTDERQLHFVVALLKRLALGCDVVLETLRNPAKTAPEKQNTKWRNGFSQGVSLGDGETLTGARGSASVSTLRPSAAVSVGPLADQSSRVNFSGSTTLPTPSRAKRNGCAGAVA